MNSLARYLATLTDVELECLRSLPLTPGERRAFELHLAHCRGPAMNEQEAATSLEMPPAEFERVSSSILRMIYGTMIPQGRHLLLGHLYCRCLHRNFEEEMRKQIDRERGEGAEAVREFLAELVWIIHHHGTNVAEDAAMLERLTAVVGEEEWTDELRLRFELARLDDAVMSAVPGERSEAEGAELRNRINDMLAQVTPETDPEVQHDALRLCYIWYTFHEGNRERSMEAIERKRDLMDRWPEEFPMRIYEHLVELADHYLTFGDTAMACALFGRVIGEYPQMLAHQPFYLDRAIAAFIAAGEFESARQMIVAAFGVDLEKASGDVAHAMRINMAYVALLTGDTQRARTHLDAIPRLDQTDCYINIEIERRLLEMTLAAQTGEEESVKRMREEGMQYLAEVELDDDPSATSLFDLLASASHHRQEGTPLSAGEEGLVREIEGLGAAGRVARLIRSAATPAGGGG